MTVISYCDLSMSKQRAPILSYDLELAELAHLDHADLDSVHVEGSSVAQQTGERVRFNTVRIVNTDLSETKAAGLWWLDVECVRSQLALAEWPQAKLARVVLGQSRATGLRLEGAELQDVRIVGCQLDYASFRGAKLVRVTFEQCRLRDADFGGADVTGTIFSDCDLQGVSFVGTKLTGADIRSCSGGDIRIEPHDVRGLIVNRQQAAAFAALLGLVVRDG